MAVRNLKTIKPGIWIPSASDPYIKITITADNGTVYTVLDTYGKADDDQQMISPASVTRNATDKLDNFVLTLANDTGRFLNVFNGGEIVKFYGDYTDATTIIFAGKIDNVNYSLNNNVGFSVEIDGRIFPELIDKTITGTEVSVKTDVALAGILNEFYSDFTLLFWNGSSWSEATYDSVNDSVSWSPAASNFPTTLINMSYQAKKGWNTITEICKRVGLDCYPEYDNDNSRWTLRTFVSGDIVNTGSSISFGVNLISLNDFGTDNGDIINRIIVYGKTESDNILLLKTENDSTSQSNLWIKDKVITDQSLTTMADVQEKADYELVQGLLSVPTGKIRTVCMPTLKPGDTIYVSIPYCNINGTYKVQGFTHTFGNSFTTDINLSQKVKEVKDLFVSKVNPEEFVTGTPNPNAMTDSYTVYFDEDGSKISHSGTEEVDGKLRLNSTSVVGVATSDIFYADTNVVACELRRYENFETKDDTYEVTNDGGDTWEPYNVDIGKVHSFNTTGLGVGFRVNMSRASVDATSPSYEAMVLLIK